MTKKIRWEDWTPSGPSGITYRNGSLGKHRVNLRVGPSSANPSLWSAVVNLDAGVFDRPSALFLTQEKAKRAAVRLANEAAQKGSIG
jgi:hypothetical protein